MRIVLPWKKRISLSITFSIQWVILCTNPSLFLAEAKTPLMLYLKIVISICFFPPCITVIAHCQTSIHKNSPAGVDDKVALYHATEGLWVNGPGWHEKNTLFVNQLEG